MQTNGPLGALGSPLFLIPKLKKKRSVAILKLKGGLGNQLFQLAGFASYLRKFGVTGVIFDYDVRLSRRDGFIARYRNLNSRVFFDGTECFRATGVLEKSIQVLRREDTANFLSIPTLREMDLETGGRLPSLFFVQDAFETIRFPERLANSDLDNLFELTQQANSRSSTNSRIALHIRLTDFLPALPPDPAFIRSSITKLTKNSKLETVDCFTDDIPNASEFLSRHIPRVRFNFPEKINKLCPEELLYEISRRNRIIGSRSSLAWWACYIALKRDPSAQVILPSGSGWHGLSSPLR